MTKRLSFEQQLQIIRGKGIEYVSGEIKNHDTYFTVRCSCGNEFSTCLRVIKNSKTENGIMVCEECRKKQARERYRIPYERVATFLEENGCKIITTKDEYEKNISNERDKIKYIATCGHVNETSIASLLKQKHFVCSKCRKKINSKENAYNWKGGVYDSETIAFRKTYDFKKWKKDVFVRDNYTCQCCHDRGGRLNAHHLDGYNWCIEKRTDIENGICLCEKCHNEFHSIFGRGNNTKEQFEEYKKMKE